jgi:DNA-directed RNA polymerase specialized sigma24 family protein
VWLEAVTSGRPVPPVLSDEELEKELHAILLAWQDDTRLSDSPLAQWVPFVAATDDATTPADGLRAAIRGALAERGSGNDELELACRALELAYLDRNLGHEQIAERLNVSRSSFYRLLHRAEREVAVRLTATSGS